MARVLRPKDFVGKYATHVKHGEVFVDSVPPRSKAMVNITITQRGPGWNDSTETYSRVLRTTPNIDECEGAKTLYWYKTKRDDYGVKELVHINELTIKE